MAMNLLIAHGGGPTAVINASLQGVIESARCSGTTVKIYAAQFGAEGILSGDLIDLTDVPFSVVRRLSLTPASAIGSCRRKLTEADDPAVTETLKRYGINVFFYNGGNDSMDTCCRIDALCRREGLDVRVIGIPKTMDNDLAVTDHSPGYGSAARYAAISAAELAMDASALPIHVVVLELMGRNAGWVTAASAFAKQLTRCEEIVCLPEIFVDPDSLLKEVKRLYAKGKGLLVAVSEGIRRPDGTPFSDTGISDGFGHVIPGGSAQAIADLISQNLGIHARAEKPGLLGRSSMAAVSEVDRREAYEAGCFAFEAALAGMSGSMVAIEAERSPAYKSRMFLTPLSAVANVEKTFPTDWILPDGQISDAFFDYAKPLIGGNLPDYAFLR